MVSEPLESLPPRHDVPAGGRSGFVRLGERQVHYLEWGHAGLPAVVCLHGGGQTAYMYEELGHGLADRYHVVAPDLPSHGDSDPIDDTEPRASRSAAEAKVCHARTKCRRAFLLAVRRSETTAWQAIMKQFVYVYILVSEVDAAKHYTGISHHLFGRLQEHNRGHCPHTAKYNLGGSKRLSHLHLKRRREGLKNT